MNWLEKLRYLKECEEKENYDKEKYYLDVQLSNSGTWKIGELEAIINPYGFVPKSYIDFIREFDSCSISFCNFYGSEKSSMFVTLLEYINELCEYGECFKKDYFPFGKNADGSAFCINKKQEVIYFYIKDHDFENPEKLANSFEEFVEDCLIGKRYKEFDNSEDNDYYDFLEHLGWV